MKRRERRAPFSSQERGFTLTELIVVLCLLTLVSVLVLPTLAAGRNSNRDMQCLENQKRLAAAWLMYASENNDTLINNPGWNGSSPPGVDGDMSWTESSDNTNTAYLKDSSRMAMAQYVQDTRVYKCPADIFKPASWAAPRVRSVTLNGALTGYGGSGPPVRGHGPDGHRSYYGSGGTSPAIGRAARTLSDLNSPGPARIFLILDEHPDSMSDSAFMFDPGPAITSEKWRDLPASYHDDNAVGISYADGHAEIHKWLEQYRPAPLQQGSSGRATWYPVVFRAFWMEFSGSEPWRSGPNMIVSRDFEWMQDGMPYRVY